MILRSLDLEALKATPVIRKPFEYFVVPGFVRPEARAKINADYPKISEGGSFPVAQLSYGPAFRQFVAELESDEFRDAFEEKFGLELAGGRRRRPFAVSAAKRMDASTPIPKARSSRSSSI